MLQNLERTALLALQTDMQFILHTHTTLATSVNVTDDWGLKFVWVKLLTFFSSFAAFNWCVRDAEGIKES